MDRHDNIADILKVHSKSFQQLYSEKVDDFMRLVMDYVKSVRATKSTGAGAGADAGKCSIRLDPDGFPMIPSPSSWAKITKGEMETIYRSYMTHHYRMLKCCTPM